MRVFLDANILLDLYHVSGPDLDEVRKIIKLAEIKKIEVLIPQQVCDEFWRNRETPSQPRQFLVHEWILSKKSELRLYKTLPDFFKQHFPEIKLADEIEKTVAIESLERTFSFASTHQAIRALSKFDDFTDREIVRLLTAYSDNNQIAWILGDEDVKEFAKKLVRLAKTDAAKELSAELAERLEALEKGQVEDDFDDDIPF